MNAYFAVGGALYAATYILFLHYSRQNSGGGR